MIEMTPELRAAIERHFAAGLTSGLGEPRPGETCVMGALALAMGEPFSDRLACVAEPDRAYLIRINDAAWPSPQARADALLPLALAALGTAGTDRSAWVRRLVEGTIRRVLPVALRAAADLHPDEAHAAALRAAADRCAADGDPAAAAALNAAAAAYAAAAYAAAPNAANAANAAYDAVAVAVAVAALRLGVEVALDAYRAEGRA